ncbi:hypothetical protein Droror1_Dr00026621 [Drosera rotundifolia]
MHGVSSWILLVVGGDRRGNVVLQLLWISGVGFENGEVERFGNLGKGLKGLSRGWDFLPGCYSSCPYCSWLVVGALVRGCRKGSAVVVP